jgi:tetrahydromethanopterin S-methyltransferase subunit C
MIGLLLLLTIISYILLKTINIIKSTDNIYFQTFAMATSCGMITYLVASLALSYSLAEYIFWAFFGLHCVTLRHASKYLKTPLVHNG